MKGRLLAATAGPLLAMTIAGAQTVTNEDLRHIRGLSDPRLSPDGAHVLIEVSETTADGGASHIWLIDAKSNASRQVTFSPDSDKAGEKHARWMGNSAILFLAKRGEHTRLYRMSMSGGEARPFNLKVAPPADASATADALPPRKADAPSPAPDPLPLDIDEFASSPDGHTVAILATDPETPGEKKQKEEKADAVWVDHDLHGKRLYLLDTDTEVLTPVAIEPDVVRVRFDRSGAQLMGYVEPPNHVGDLEPATRAFLVKVNDPSHPQQIHELPPTIEEGVFSDDGRRYSFRSQSTQDAPPGYSDLYVIDLQTHRIEHLAPRFEGSFAHGPIFAIGSAIFHSAQVGTSLGYVKVASDRTEQIKFPTPVVSGLDSDTQRHHWVWLGQGSDMPPALYYGARPGSDAHVLTTPALLPHSFPAHAAEHVRWNNEGLELEGLLFRPAAMTGPVPLIVEIHGGPTGAWVERFDPLSDFLLAQGWAVFQPNIRGSTGYGTSFAGANKNDMGGADYRDIMSAVDKLLSTGQFDPGRMVLMGYSYGGEMAAFVEGKTDRFKAVVSGAPVIDQQSEYGTEDDSWYDRWFYGKPWEHPDDAWRQSPLALASRARSPFLLIQGEADKVDPPGQSQEMYRALRQSGVHVELIQYPREDHGPLAGVMSGFPSQEPWHGFDVRRRLVKFISDAFTRT